VAGSQKEKGHDLGGIPLKRGKGKVRVSVTKLEKAKRVQTMEIRGGKPSGKRVGHKVQKSAKHQMPGEKNYKKGNTIAGGGMQEKMIEHQRRKEN